jgi:hypothetical protein
MPGLAIRYMPTHSRESLQRTVHPELCVGCPGRPARRCADTGYQWDSRGPRQDIRATRKKDIDIFGADFLVRDVSFVITANTKLKRDGNKQTNKQIRRHALDANGRSTARITGMGSGIARSPFGNPRDLRATTQKWRAHGGLEFMKILKLSKPWSRDKAVPKFERVPCETN